MRWNRRQGSILLPLLLFTSLAHAGVQLVVDGVDDNLEIERVCVGGEARVVA